MMPKTKKRMIQLDERDHLYTIEQTTQKVIPLTIAKVQGMTNSRLVKITLFKIVAPKNANHKIEVVIDRAIEISQNIPKETFIFPGDQTMVFTAEMPPRVFATTKEELESWKFQSQKNVN